MGYLCAGSQREVDEIVTDYLGGGKQVGQPGIVDGCQCMKAYQWRDRLRSSGSGNAANTNNVLRDVGAGHTPGGRIHCSTETTAAAGAGSCQRGRQLSVYSVSVDQTGDAVMGC